MANEVLTRLAETTGEAIVRSLIELGAAVELERVEVFNNDHQAFHDVAFPLVLSRIIYSDGVVGGNLALLPEEGAQKLAQVLLGEERGDSQVGQEALLAATGEAMNKLMTEAAHVTGEVLGHDVACSEPETHFVTGAEMLSEIYAESASTFSTRIELKLFGESCLIVQLVPRSSIVKLTRALDDAATSDYSDDGILPSVPLERLLDMPVRVSVEFGETRMSFAKASQLAANEVVALERSMREPVRLLADGQLVALGRLKTRDGRLTFLIEEILPSASKSTGY